MTALLRQFVSVAALTLIAALAAAQAQDAVLQEITLRGTVEAIDHPARTVRIRGVQGNVVTLDVPATATRFDQVRIGDSVTIAYDRPREHQAQAARRSRRRPYDGYHVRADARFASRWHARDSACHDGHDRRVGSGGEDRDLHDAKRPICPPRQRTGRCQRDRRAQGGRPRRCDSGTEAVSFNVERAAPPPQVTVAPLPLSFGTGSRCHSSGGRTIHSAAR